MAERNEALGLSHVEEARLCTLGVELREQVAAMTNEKESNLISWARDNRTRDATIAALERQDASKSTELEAVKAELTRVRSELAAAATLSGAGVTSSGQTEGCKCSLYKRTRRWQDYSLVWIHRTWAAHSKWRRAETGSSGETPEERTEQLEQASC